MHRTNIVWGVLGRTIRRHPWLSAALLACVVGSIVMALYPPLVLGRIVDIMTSGQLPDAALILAYFGALALAGLFTTGQEALLSVFGQKTTHDMRSQLNDKLARLPASYFTNNQPGTITARLVNDVDTIEVLFDSGIISMIVDAGKIIGIFVVILTKSMGLAIILAAVTPLLYMITRHFQKRMLTAQIANRKAVAKVNGHVPQTIRVIRMIHTFHKEQYMEDRYDDYIQDSYAALEHSNFYDSIYSPTIMTASSLIIAAIMVLAARGGAYQAFFGLSVGSAVAVIAYVNQIFEPLEAIGMEIQNVQAAMAGLYRINDFMAGADRLPPDPSLDGGKIFDRGQPALELKDVTFGYEPDKPVLQGVSLRIEHGENVTLAGRTGAGKSTIFRLLLGLYSPQAGQVLVNGQTADLIPDTAKRRLFGYVEQSFHPVLGTIRDQIALGDPTITDAAVAKAAALVGLGTTIDALPHGFDTPYSANLFSQGQWQLLAIARSVAADPQILLLDEITANLDSSTERTVLQALERASQGRTVLSISHRLYERTGGRLITLD